MKIAVCSIAIALFLLCVSPLFAGSVEWIALDGAIGPVAYKFIHEGMKRAEDTHAQALVIEMDTPGGLLSTTREICKEFLSSPVPVCIYVAPSGARAGSAGVFLTLAAHVAAMAHGTNIGAAHPVTIGGGGMGSGDTSKVMAEKVTNDAAAFARTLAERHHRNVEWAERAVRESVSATETEALNLGIIDFIAASRDSLLLLMNGRVVDLNGRSDTLATANAEIRETKMDFRLRILSFLTDPNIAYIFMLLGIYGLFFELYNPGAIFPGIVGGLSLIVALYSMQLLPLNWAGLLLILLGVVMFLLEIKITSYGMLTIGGVTAMVLGSLMLFEPIKASFHVGLELILAASVTTALFFFFVVGKGIQAQRRKISTGAEGLIGETGLVSVALNPRGKVQVHGEWWEAEASESLAVGTPVVVKAVAGMKLVVEKR